MCYEGLSQYDAAKMKQVGCLYLDGSFLFFYFGISLPNNSKYVSDLHISQEPFSEKGDVDEWVFKKADISPCWHNLGFWTELFIEKRKKKWVSFLATACRVFYSNICYLTPLSYEALTVYCLIILSPTGKICLETLYMLKFFADKVFYFLWILTFFRIHCMLCIDWIKSLYVYIYIQLNVFVMMWLCIGL